jgi:hypothetical protein
MVVNLAKPGPESGRAFLTDLRRARRYLTFYDRDANERGWPNRHAVVLLESAIVFAVAALDAYLRDLILEVVPTYGLPNIQRKTKLMEDVARSDPNLIVRLATISDEYTRKAELHDAMARALSSRVFQGEAGITYTLECLDCPFQWGEFNTATGRRDVQGQLRRITELRHRLVHQAKGPRITRDQADAALDLIQAVGLHVNQRVKDRYNIP